MSKYLICSCQDYKGGELSIKIKESFKDYNKEDLKRLKRDMGAEYAGCGEGSPTRVFTIEDGAFKELDFTDIKKLIK